MGKWQKYNDMLPVTTRAGILSGHIPSDWQINAVLYSYSACCQDPRNWVGTGKPKELSITDPYYRLGYDRCRKVKCGQCGEAVIGHEYIREEAVL